MRTLLTLLLLLVTLTAAAYDPPTRHTRRWHARHLKKLQQQHRSRTVHHGHR